MRASGLGTPVLSNAPLLRTAWRRLRRRPLQYALFIVGVALGVAMMVSIDLANGAAGRAFQLSTDAIAGRTTHVLVGGPTGLDEAFYRRLRVELGIRPSAPVVEGLVQVPRLGDQPYRLIGVDPFAEPPFRSYLGGDQAAGGEGLGALLTRPGSVLAAADVARRHGVALGDTVTLSIAGVARSAQVVGLIEPADDLTRRGLDGLIFTDIASAQELLGMRGRLSRIDLIATDAQLAALQSALPPGVRVEPATARSNAVQQMTAAFRLNLTALSLLALVVGMFLIYNTVTFSVVQRRPLFGVLRCLGVTGGQLALLIMTEALVLGLVGSLLGLGLGVLLGQGMVRLVTQTINDLYFTVSVREVPVPPLSLVRGLAIGVAAALIASALPAVEALRTTPNSTLRRSTLESRVQGLLPWLVAGWVVLGALGVLLLRFERGGLIAAFGGLFAVLFAFALITPPLTVVMMRGLTPLTQWAAGALGRLAPRDIVRALSRTSVAIAALMVAVSVIVGVSIMIGSFRVTVVQWLDQTLQADVYISPPSAAANAVDGALDPALLALAADWPGVARGVTARTVDVVAPDFGRAVNLTAVSGDIARGGRPYLWVDGDRAEIWPRLLAGEGVIISEPLLVREQLPTPPPPITLVTDQGPRQFPVLAVFYDYASDQGVIWIGDDLYRTLWQDTAISTLALFAEETADVDAIVADLRAAFAPIQTVNVRSNQALRDNSIAIFDRTFAITAALRLLATVVAFIGVLSALLSLQLERTRELGTLRAAGLTRGQLWRLTLLETGLMGTTAGVLAMPTGYALAWVLVYVINLRSFGWTLQMQLDPTYFLQALFVAVVAALLAGVYPAWRLGQMVIATAIRSD